MQQIQGNISKTSRWIAGILLVGCILMVAATVGIVVGILALLIGGNGLSAFLQEAFAGQVAQGMAIPATSSLVSALGFALLQMAAMMTMFIILRRIFRDMGNGQTPFAEKQVARIRNVALVSLILCIIQNVTEAIVQYTIFQTDTFSLDIMWFVFTIVIYCLAYIFDYGAQLQRQADETL